MGLKVELTVSKAADEDKPLIDEKSLSQASIPTFSPKSLSCEQ
jgi:hypothetical protein